jgi:biotin transport system substrate-specific component
MSTDASTDPTTATPTRTRRRLGTTDLALVTAFAALIAACTYVGAVPVGGAGVPITLQTLAVVLAGCLLGPVRGFLAATLYLALGAIGLPVYAEHTSGLAVFSQPSAGYLVSFPVAALVAGLLVAYVARERRTRALVVFFCALVPGFLVIHPAGIAGLVLSLDLTFRQALNIDALYWVGDLLKTTVIALVAAEVHRAFPQLLARR